MLLVGFGRNAWRSFSRHVIVLLIRVQFERVPLSQARIAASPPSRFGGRGSRRSVSVFTVGVDSKMRNLVVDDFNYGGICNL